MARTQANMWWLQLDPPLGDGGSGEEEGGSGGGAGRRRPPGALLAGGGGSGGDLQLMAAAAEEGSTALALAAPPPPVQSAGFQGGVQRLTRGALRLWRRRLRKLTLRWDLSCLISSYSILSCLILVCSKNASLDVCTDWGVPHLFACPQRSADGSQSCAILSFAMWLTKLLRQLAGKKSAGKQIFLFSSPLNYTNPNL